MSNARGIMNLEIMFSTLAFAAFIWAVGFLIPRAIKERDALAIASAVLTALLALLGVLLVGVRVTSERSPRVPTPAAVSPLEADSKRVSGAAIRN